MKILKEIQKICNGIEYSRHVPDDAVKLAKENNCVIIVGGSDDLIYCYGADCYLTSYCEHGYGWDGNTLQNISDKKLEDEANQLGLMIWWCGEIESDGLKLENYDVDKMGAFSYTVKEGIKSLDFKVVEGDDIYCAGKVIQLPNDF